MNAVRMIADHVRVEDQAEAHRLGGVTCRRWSRSSLVCPTHATSDHLSTRTQVPRGLHLVETFPRPTVDGRRLV